MRVNMTNTVKGFILAKPELADNDVDLIYAIWAYQLLNHKPIKKIEKLSARQLMKCWKEGILSSPFNISRSRRKCQEIYEETRGKTHKTRHAHEEVIKRDVKREALLSDRGATERSDGKNIKSS